MAKNKRGNDKGGDYVVDREIMLALVGATALPQPYPEVGTIALSDDKRDVEITSVLEPYRVVRYTMPLDRVKALYATDVRPERLSRDGFSVGADVKKALEKGTVTGLVFVLEDAPVIYRTETALTAADIPCADRPIKWTCCD